MASKTVYSLLYYHLEISIILFVSAGAIPSVGSSNNNNSGSQELYSRIRSRQAIFKFETNALGQQWRLGGVRLDMRADGRR